MSGFGGFEWVGRQFYHSEDVISKAHSCREKDVPFQALLSRTCAEHAIVREMGATRNHHLGAPCLICTLHLLVLQTAITTGCGTSSPDGMQNADENARTD